MFRALSRLLSPVHEHPGTPLPGVLTDLRERVESLERAEALRAGEHAQMVDRMERLYKRMAARVAREPHPELETSTESPLTLRQRLRGR